MQSFYVFVWPPINAHLFEDQSKIRDVHDKKMAAKRRAASFSIMCIMLILPIMFLALCNKLEIASLWVIGWGRGHGHGHEEEVMQELY